MKKILWKNVALCAAGIAILIAVWCIAHVAVGNDLLVPDFFRTLKIALTTLGTSAFWKGVLSSCLRVVIGFSVSFIFAVIFAVIAYLYPTFRQIFAPMVGVLRAMPVLGVMVLILTWTSASMAPIVVAFLSLFPMLYTEILSAFLGIDSELIEMSNAYRVPLKRQIRQLYLPLALPHVLRSCGGALGFGVKLIVSAEALSRTVNSLGGQMQDAQIVSELPVVFALIIVACVLAFLLETLLTSLANGLERRRK